MVEKGQYPLAFSEDGLGSDCGYSLEEFKEHIANIVYLLKKYSNYSVYIADSKWENHNVIYAKEHVGAIIAKKTEPKVYFAINEDNMTAAIWDYLINEIQGMRLKKRESIIKELEDYIN